MQCWSGKGNEHRCQFILTVSRRKWEKVVYGLLVLINFVADWSSFSPSYNDLFPELDEFFDTNLRVFVAALCASQGKVYLDCGLTCENFLMSDSARASRCKPGCYCPGNQLLLENGTCVEKSECGCKHNNKFYQKGDVSPVDCSKYVIVPASLWIS